MRTLEPKLSRMVRRFDEPVPVPVPVPEPEEPEPDGSGGPVVYAGYSFIRRSVRGVRDTHRQETFLPSGCLRGAEAGRMIEVGRARVVVVVRRLSAAIADSLVSLS